MFYKNIEDLQGASWFLNHIDTIENWRELAISWADGDGHDGVVEILRTLPEDRVIDYIADFWQLDIIPLQCWHESCDRKAVYELDTCDGETVHVCEMCDMMWSNCDHCGKSDVVGEGINICGDSFLCDRCLDERQSIIVTKAAETYIKEVESDGPEELRLELYSINSAQNKRLAQP